MACCTQHAYLHLDPCTGVDQVGGRVVQADSNVECLAAGCRQADEDSLQEVLQAGADELQTAEALGQSASSCAGLVSRPSARQLLIGCAQQSPPAGGPLVL